MFDGLQCVIKILENSFWITLVHFYTYVVLLAIYQAALEHWWSETFTKQNDTNVVHSKNYSLLKIKCYSITNLLNVNTNWFIYILFQIENRMAFLCIRNDYYIRLCIVKCKTLHHGVVMFHFRTRLLLRISVNLTLVRIYWFLFYNFPDILFITMFWDDYNDNVRARFLRADKHDNVISTE